MNANVQIEAGNNDLIRVFIDSSRQEALYNSVVGRDYRRRTAGGLPSCTLRLLSDEQPYLLMRQLPEKPDTSHTSPESFFETPRIDIISSPGAKTTQCEGYIVVPAPKEVTRLLVAWSNRDRAAQDELIPMDVVLQRDHWSTDSAHARTSPPSAVVN